MRARLALLAIALPFSAALCIATPVKLKNREADELLAASLSVQSGLSAANTTVLADNINELRPKVEAFAKGNQEAQKRLKVTANTKTDDPAAEKYLTEIEANRDAEVTVDLGSLVLSDEEIVNAKLTPQVLSVLRRYLVAPKKK